MPTLPDLLAHFPPEPDETALFPEIQQAVARSKHTLVVIDDDPTGTQTVHDVELLTTWNSSLLTAAFHEHSRLFYLLTNSRSLPEHEAAQLNYDLAQQLVDASQATDTNFVIASRSDSTLRGHYPAEINALEAGLLARGQAGFDGHLLIPAFFEGGRYTIADTHYVATSTAPPISLVPAHETPFAQDSVFGYKTAYLPEWIQKKSSGRWQASQVISVGLEMIRQEGPEAVAHLLSTVTGGTPVVINAAGYGDLAVVVLGLLQAEAKGKRFVYRTAASFVRLRAAVTPKPLLTAQEILLSYPQSEPQQVETSAQPPDALQPQKLYQGKSNRSGGFAVGASSNKSGAIVVVGSYVPGSSIQLEHLLTLPYVVGIELPVNQVIIEGDTSILLSHEIGQQLEAVVSSGRVGVLYTSRGLLRGNNATENLEIGKKVSAALIAVLHEVTTPPRFIIAKGGITSHDVAQKGLGADRAFVLGQLFPGVPVWRLEQTSQSRFSHIPYIVFPGNVGGPESLKQAVELLTSER